MFLFKKNVCFCITIAALLNFISCNLITEPDRIINSNAKPPEVNYFNFSELLSGQHVDGKLFIEFNPQNINFGIDYVRLLIDESDRGSDSESPYRFQFDTRYFSEGTHKINFYIYSTDQSEIGLGNLLRMPKAIQTNELYFDRTEPLPVNVSAENINLGKAVNLKWTESQNENFAAYLIARSYDNSHWNTIDTIYNKEQLNFIDSAQLNITGLQIYYNVTVCTDREFSYKKPNIFKHVNGDFISYSSFENSALGPLANPVLPEIYYLGDKDLVSFSAAENKFIRKLFLGEISNFPGTFRMTTDYNGNYIYIWQLYSNDLLVIDAVNFQLNRKVLLPFSETRGGDCELVYIKGDKLLFKTTDETIRILDIESNTVLTELKAPENVDFSASAVTKDGTRLVLSEIDRNAALEQPKMTVRDLESPNLDILYEKDFIHFVFSLIRISEDSKKIIAQSSYDFGTVHVIDFNTLDLLKNFNLSTTRLLNFTTWGDKILIIFEVPIVIPEINVGIGGKKLICYDENNYAVEKEWLLTKSGFYLAINSNKIFLDSYLQDISSLIVHF